MASSPGPASPRLALCTRRTFVTGATAVAVLHLAGCGGSDADPNDPLRGALNGSGATFPKTFYEVAIYEFLKQHKATTITYSGGGSGRSGPRVRSNAPERLFTLR